MLKTTLVTLILLLFFGCTNKEQKLPIVKKDITYTCMYVKSNVSPFVKGEKIKVYKLANGIAHTDKGEIPFSYLEKDRTYFRLNVQTQNGARVRILNIKPKYKNNIWLKKGKYLLEVSAKKYIMKKQWINLYQDTNIAITLQRKKNISLGFIYWQEIKNLKYINGLFWQDQAINKQKTMDWNSAKKYCSNLKIKINHDFIDDFALPTEDELVLLRKENSKFEYLGNRYWSVSSDEKHPQFAKYVYMKNKKRGWYNKSGQMYVRCVSRKNYPSKLGLQAFAQYFMKHENYRYLHALEKAVNIQYGKPLIKYVKKDKSNTIKFTLRSQKYDSKKLYFYNKQQTTNSIKNIKTDPKIKFEIINDKLIYRGIY